MLVACLVFLLSLIFAVFTSRSLYDDGSYYFVRVLQAGGFTEMLFNRGHVAYLYQLPVVIALKLGITDLSKLQVAFGIGCFCAWPLTMGICYRLAPKHFWIVVLACGAGYLNAAFVAVGEHVVAHAFFWPIVLVIIGLVVGLAPRLLARHRLVTEGQEAAMVDVVTATPFKPDFGTPLPAEVRPFTQAAIHARASGFLKNWYVDIGTTVTNGQLLAEIETPEIDQQLAQARAELEQAQAMLDLAKITADRWTDLLKSASVSEQETAEKTADYKLKQANVNAAQANVRRLEELKNFGRVVAPFAGTVIARNTDIGQLISASSGTELFGLAQTDPLRVYVRVPQTLVSAIDAGQNADLTFQEKPGRVFTATVTRTAGAVDPATRTLLVELQTPNPNGEILSGSYAQARFKDSGNASGLSLSDNALIFRAQGMQIAVVDGSNIVHLHSIKLGRDFGKSVEVLNGLDAGERVIVNPPDAIAEGMTVRIAPANTNSAAQ